MRLILLTLMLLADIVISRPLMQRIVIDGHEWEVPNESGWEEVLLEANAARERIFRSCTTLAECRQVVDELYAVFSRHPVSKKYLETNKDEVDDILSSIFKWG
ncbi:unnamed protein product [Adineta ricciae]|uniref:Uncharacterized protein n=2 Tax=Adineta ricciae TaxID=249248 RepID=A0A814TFC6_ADIRI|nr:unnamed protein product [Adineta ricciae]